MASHKATVVSVFSTSTDEVKSTLSSIKPFESEDGVQSSTRVQIAFRDNENLNALITFRHEIEVTGSALEIFDKIANFAVDSEAHFERQLKKSNNVVTVHSRQQVIMDEPVEVAL